MGLLTKPYGSIVITRSGVLLTTVLVSPLIVLNMVQISVPRLCPFFYITGLPCPLCGMTRGIVSILRIELTDALLFHFLSPLTFACMLVIYLTVLLPDKTVKVKVTFGRLMSVQAVLVSAWTLKLLFVDQIYW